MQRVTPVACTENLLCLFFSAVETLGGTRYAFWWCRSAYGFPRADAPGYLCLAAAMTPCSATHVPNAAKPTSAPFAFHSSLLYTARHHCWAGAYYAAGRDGMPHTHGPCYLPLPQATGETVGADVAGSPADRRTRGLWFSGLLTYSGRWFCRYTPAHALRFTTTACHAAHTLPRCYTERRGCRTLMRVLVCVAVGRRVVWALSDAAT